MDYAHTPDALSRVLTTLRQVCSGRLICVFGADADRESDDWPAMGRVVGALADMAVVTNNGPNATSHRACVALHGGFADRRKARVVIQRDEAIACALHEARAGDTVIIAGMGERVSCAPQDDEPPVNDQAIVRQTLSGGLAAATQRMAA